MESDSDSQSVSTDIMEYSSGSNRLSVQGMQFWLSLEHVSNEELHDSDRDEKTLDNEDSTEMDSQDDLWQIVGQDMLLEIPEERFMELAGLFPGSRNHPSISVFGSTCGHCLKPLEADDAVLDHYDCKLYCSMCHQYNSSEIPRDILQNWDFSKKTVSYSTALFLRSISQRPIANLASTNPTIYSGVEALAGMRCLRRTLALLWCILTRCNTAIPRAVSLALGPRKYMLSSVADIDIYSMTDLIAVRHGDLEEHLNATINTYALPHLYSCKACRSWTIICDICKDFYRPIWPHKFVQFRRCVTSGCSKAMHINCLLREKDEKFAYAEIFRIVNFEDDKSEDHKRTGATPAGLELLPRCQACKLNFHISSGALAPQSLNS